MLVSICTGQRVFFGGAKIYTHFPSDFVPTEASISSTELEEPNHVEGSGDHLTNVVPSSTHPYPPGPVEEPSTPPTVRIPGLEFPLPGARASLRLAFVLPNVIRDDFGNPGDYSSPAVTYPVYPSGVLQNAGQIVLYCGLILPPIIFIGSLIVPPVDGVFAGFGA